MAEEVWRPVPGFEDGYEVSNRGRVRSIGRVVPHRRLGRYTVRERVLAAAVQKRSGLLQVVLSDAGVQRRFYVHKLAAQAGLKIRSA